MRGNMATLDFSVFAKNCSFFLKKNDWLLNYARKYNVKLLIDEDNFLRSPFLKLRLDMILMNPLQSPPARLHSTELTYYSQYLTHLRL